MTFVDLVQSQLLDPFRIGLLVALVLTTRRTAAHTGNWLPLAPGVLFVAVIIPATLSTPQAGLMTAIGAGLMSNAIILAVILGLSALWSRFAGSPGGDRS